MTELQFYTNFLQRGNKVMVRGYSASHDLPVYDQYDIEADLFTTKKTPISTQYKTLKEQPLYKIPFESVKDRKEFIKERDDTFYGATRLDYSTIGEIFSNGITLTPKMRSKIRTVALDIEVESETCFAKPHNPVERVNAVSVVYRGKTYALALVDHKPDENTQFKFCESEYELFENLKKILKMIEPDIISGWYCELFDIPYLVERSKILYGDDSWGRAISPWGYVIERTEKIFGDSVTLYEFAGITVLDYHELYTHFGKKQPSYTLKDVTADELGESKIPFDGSFKDFYREFPDRFCAYNIQDARLIEKLDLKLNYFGLAFMIAYKSMCRYKDIYSQVRLWEVKFYNEVRHKYNILPHIKEGYVKSDPFEGAYVHDPIPGMYYNSVTFDVAGEYPSLIIGLNISPETFVERVECNVDMFFKKKHPIEEARRRNCSLAVNGAMFSLEKEGIIPNMLQSLADERNIVKKQMFEFEKKIEERKKLGLDYNELELERILLDNTQTALKLSGNSCYGWLGAPSGMFFNVDIAEAVTVSGKYTVQNVSINLEKYLQKVVGDEKQKFWVYSDTDSTILSLDAVVKKFIPGASIDKIEYFLDKICATKLRDVIAETFIQQKEDQNARLQKLSMKREYICDRIIIVKSKNYALHVLNKEGGVHLAKPEIKIKGLEAVKTSTPNICRSKIKECIELMFTSDEDAVIAYIQKFREEFNTLDPVKIGWPIGANGFPDYVNKQTGHMKKGIPQQLRAAVVFNNMLVEYSLTEKYQGIQEGDKIKCVFLKPQNRARSDVIAFKDILPPELNLDNFIDRDAQFERVFIKPVKRLLDVIGWNVEHVETLDDLFG